MTFEAKKVRDAILSEGNGGLYVDEIVLVSGLTLAAVNRALDQLGEKVAETAPGVWMVVSR